MKKKALMLIACVLILTMFTACSKSVEQQIAEQLELGQKYLVELNYDEAIVAFQKVIELDAKNADAYLRIAEAYMGQKESGQAVAYLEQGFAEIGEESITSEYKEFLIDTYRFLARDCEEAGDMETAEKYYDMILEIDSADNDAAERKEALVNRRELEQYYEDIVNTAKQLIGDDDSDISSSLLFSDEFKELVDGLKDPVIYETDSGVYMGVYPGGYIYYGEMKDGLREGNGNWFWVTLDSENGHKSYCIFSGIWHNDYPNGEGKLVNESLNRVANFIMKRVDTGNCVDGYFDGPIVIISTNQDGETHTFDMVLHGGKPEVLAERDSEYPYIFSYSRENGRDLFVGDDNTRFSVSGAVKE